MVFGEGGVTIGGSTVTCLQNVLIYKVMLVDGRRGVSNDVQELRPEDATVLWLDKSAHLVIDACMTHYALRHAYWSLILGLQSGVYGAHTLGEVALGVHFHRNFRHAKWD